MSSEKEVDPKMHTAEHLLNAAMVRMFNRGRCFSAHIEKKKSKCDYRFDRPLEAAEVSELEKKVNGAIADNLEVLEEFLPRAEAEKIYNLERLPEDAGDSVRIVKIGDYDGCPCIGPHARATGELGHFRIISSDFADGILRIRYKLSAA